MLASRTYIPDKADIVWIDLSPTKGHEQAGRRPVLVLSPQAYNSRAGLMLICPITSKSKGYPFEVKVSGEKTSGVVLSDQLRSLDWQTRKATFIEFGHPDLLEEVRQKLLKLI